jgi:large subunit ribosomal protein L9
MMNVILQEKVKNLGTIGDQVSVKSGYARNYLIPKGVAVMATTDNIASFEARRAEFEKAANDKLAVAKTLAEKVAGLTVTISAKAGEEGKLFGSVGPREIAVAVKEQGIDIAKSDIAMPEGPIRHTGEYEVSLHLHMDLTEVLKITVVEAKD